MIGQIFIFLGAFCIFLGALGFFHFQQPLQRFHTATVIGLVGLGFIVVGEILETVSKTGDWTFREIFIFPILFVVNPLASHLLARAKLQATDHFQS